LVHSNLDHAFPERSAAWKQGIARESSRRLFETALVSLAGPFLTERRVREMITVSPEVVAYFQDHHARPFPMIVSTPHMAYWETLTWLRLFLPTPLPEFGVIFRPLDNPAADAWVKETRERYGMKLLSRKTGLQESFKILKRNGVVGVLFDQNAGMQGALTTLLGRVCSTSELPGMLAERSSGRVVAYYARRLGFWRVKFELSEITREASAADTTLALNRWLETALSSDDNLCASWLWSHDRWRNQDIPDRRFRLEAKRDLLAQDIQAHGWTALPRKTRVWVRMPNWLGDVVMALPLLRALRTSRPDAEITVICKGAFAPLLEAAGCADQILPLPARGRGYFGAFYRLRRRFPDVYVLFTHSTRGDIEARLTGCRQRFGVVRHGKPRKLLTHAYAVPPEFSEASHHQLELWENFFRRFGLAGELDRTPLSLPVAPEREELLPSSKQHWVGLIAGSENSPEKRWPVQHWNALIKNLASAHPDVGFVLFGTKNDRAITQQIRGNDSELVVDLAGKTDLRTYMQCLVRCRVLVSNDTGGMHLANALGVPIVGLFGPTNPVRTGPVFTAARDILQPPGCPTTGGASLELLSPETVASVVSARLVEK
jgi:heptosyltransferase II